MESDEIVKSEGNKVYYIDGLTIWKILLFTCFMISVIRFVCKVKGKLEIGF